MDLKATLSQTRGKTPAPRTEATRTRARIKWLRDAARAMARRAVFNGGYGKARH